MPYQQAGPKQAQESVQAHTICKRQTFNPLRPAAASDICPLHGHVQLVLRAVWNTVAYEMPKNVTMPMRDGIKLAANIFRTDAETPAPVILLRTPYGKPGPGWDRAEEWVRLGFIVVAQDCRGRGNSEGSWEPFEGGESGVEDWPAYQIFVMGANQWRGENEWPIERTRYVAYYLNSGGKANSRHGDGSLTTALPMDEPSDVFSYDGDDPVPTHGGNNLVGATAGPYNQAQIEERPDVLVYSTEPLTDAVEVTGPVKATVFASSTGRDTDFTAKLVDVHPDGHAYNVCEGIVRARFRNGMDQEELLEPGEVYSFDIDMWVTSIQFMPGHRIRVEISSSNFPRFDRNPNSGQTFGDDTELLTATQTVRHDTAHASHVLLPVIPQKKLNLVRPVGLLNLAR